jgi:hypothetical protein
MFGAFDTVILMKDAYDFAQRFVCENVAIDVWNEAECCETWYTCQHAMLAAIGLGDRRNAL